MGIMSQQELLLYDVALNGFTVTCKKCAPYSDIYTYVSYVGENCIVIIFVICISMWQETL